MSELFSHNNLLLRGMQSNNELLAKTFKKISKITFTASRFSILTSAKIVNSFITIIFESATFWVLLQATFMYDWKKKQKKQDPLSRFRGVR